MTLYLLGYPIRLGSRGVQGNGITFPNSQLSTVNPCWPQYGHAMTPTPARSWQHSSSPYQCKGTPGRGADLSFSLGYTNLPPWEQAQPVLAAVSSGLCEQDLTQKQQLRMCSKPASCQACWVMHLELHRCSQAERPYFFSPLYLGESLSNERCGERSSWWLNGSGFCHHELIEMLGWIFCPQPCTMKTEVLT